MIAAMNVEGPIMFRAPYLPLHRQNNPEGERENVYLSARYPVDNRPTMEAALAIDTSV
jgi:hypothetical protein